MAVGYRTPGHWGGFFQCLKNSLPSPVHHENSRVPQPEQWKTTLSRNGFRPFFHNGLANTAASSFVNSPSISIFMGSTLQNLGATLE